MTDLAAVPLRGSQPANQVVVRNPPEQRIEPLTEREREILVLVAHGHANKEIARQLGISERTARTHVSNILGKLGLASRTQAALYAIQRGLVPAAVT